MRAATRGASAVAAILLLSAASLSTSSCYGRTHFIALGTAVDVLPHGFLTVTVASVPYYYHRGVFYRPHPWGYVVVPAPLGAIVPGPPPGHVVILVENDPFVYYRGVFYATRGERYVVVRAPPGAFVRRLPEAATTRRIDGVSYKEYAGVYYRPAIRRGRPGYVVAEAPQGRAVRRDG